MSPPPSSPPELPLKPIPGSYGLPFLGPMRDRLAYFYYQGSDEYFASRIRSHNHSTVIRTNMPPGPFVAADSTSRGAPRRRLVPRPVRQLQGGEDERPRRDLRAFRRLHRRPQDAGLPRHQGPQARASQIIGDVVPRFQARRLHSSLPRFSLPDVPGHRRSVRRHSDGAGQLQRPQ
ncbi:unnamed protein product [Linum trigynum]|uniref:Uncharacterized protein n=1 Tax=Linum trigynum TaxID=586398 RepID=A0AAV2EV83_9ROSI